MNFWLVRNLAKKLMLISFILVLTACIGAGKTLVLEPPKIVSTVQGITIVRNASTVNIPLEYQEKFEKKLQEGLYKKNIFVKGNDLTVKYSFIQSDPGSKFCRWLFGGIGNAGEGSITVESNFFNKEGKKIGKIHTEGKIGSGFLGGSFDNAIEQSAHKLSEYIIKNCKGTS